MDLIVIIVKNTFIQNYSGMKNKIYNTNVKNVNPDEIKNKNKKYFKKYDIIKNKY